MIAVDQIIGSGVVNLPSKSWTMLRHRRDISPARVDLAHPVSERIGLLQGVQKITYQAAVAQVWAEDADLKAQRPRDRHIVGDHPAYVARLGLRCTAYHPDHPVQHPLRVVSLDRVVSPERDGMPVISRRLVLPTPRSSTTTLTTLSSIRSGWSARQGGLVTPRPAGSPLASIMRIWSANASASCKESHGSPSVAKPAARTMAMYQGRWWLL